MAAMADRASLVWEDSAGSYLLAVDWSILTDRSASRGEMRLPQAFLSAKNSVV